MGGQVVIPIATPQTAVGPHCVGVPGLLVWEELCVFCTREGGEGAGERKVKLAFGTRS